MVSGCSKPLQAFDWWEVALPDNEGYFKMQYMKRNTDLKVHNYVLRLQFKDPRLGAVCGGQTGFETRFYWAFYCTDCMIKSGLIW